MKKLLLTIGTVALISMAGMAQQDTTQSNQYRPLTRPQPEQPIDTAEINEDAWEQGQDIRRGTDSINYDDMQPNMEQPADTLQQGTEQSGDGSESSANQAQEQREEGGDVMTQESAQEPQSSEDQTRDQGAASDGSAAMDQPASPGPAVEVLESKEGPNNEVVYEIDGELYYVDKDKKELVKANRSELKDNKHEVKIHEGTATEDDSRGNRKRSKG